jgi:serine/threonine protein kinase
MGPRDPFDLVGATIAGRFRVERVLGEGGFGVVYGGTHLLLDVPVAIKAMKPAGATEDERAEATERFLREARILFELTHPSIVRLYEVGVVPDKRIPYAVLELLRGTTLQHEIEQRARDARALSRDELLAVFGPILDAVAFAHERGVIHRDLKPTNLMLVPEATRVTPKVLDFGTARTGSSRLPARVEAPAAPWDATVLDVPAPSGPAGAGAAASPMTRSGFTPLYAAPEQWEATAFGPPAPHTDVFALGLTIFEACLLRYPFEEASSLAGIFRMISDESKRPSLVKARPDLPFELERVLIRAVHVRPEERFPDAREMLAAFRGALEARPSTASELPPAATGSKASALAASTTTAPLARPMAAPPRGSAPAPPPAVAATPPPPAPPVSSGFAPPAPPGPPPGFAPAAARPRASSPLPWIAGAAALVVTILAAAAALGAWRAWSARARAGEDHHPVAVAAGAPGEPELATRAGASPSEGASASAPAGSPAAPPSIPAAPARTPRPAHLPALALGSVIGAPPCWTNAEILAVLRAHHGPIAACTAASAALDPKLAGDVSVTVSPSKDGVVESVMCGMPKMPEASKPLCDCMEAEIQSIRFPASHGKLGLLDAKPFIASYRLRPAP